MEDKIKDYLEKEIVDLCDERDSFKGDAKDKVQYDKNIVQMFDAYNDRLKLDYDDYTAERQLEYEKDKYLAEIEQKDRQVKEEGKHSRWKNILYGVATAAGVGLALLSRKDEREGFIPDDKISFFDKFTRNKP